MSFIIDDLKLDEYEYEVYLCKPSYPYEIVKCLTNCIDNRNFKWILRQPDEFSFKIYDTFEDGSVNDAYDDIVNASVIMVEKLIDKTVDRTSLYHISEVNPINDATNCKEVKAYSLEVRMNKQSVKDFEFSTNLYTGIWDIDDLPNSGIVDYILTLFNGNWSIDYVTPSINGVGKQRKFNIKDSKTLDVIKIIEDNYNCMFIFRTDVQEIDIVEYDDDYMGMFTNNGLILNDNNYIQQYNSQINVDDVVTRLYIEGANNSSINSINILGTKYIDDFSFFMNTDYMSQGLIDALNSLISLRASQQSNYNSELSNLNTATGDLIDLKDELSILKGELIILEDRQDMAIRTGMLIEGFNYEHWKTQGDNKQSEIDAKNIEITNKESEINGITNNLNAISTLVSYEENLASIQLKELTNFIQEGKVRFETDVPSELLELGQAYLDTFYGLQFDIKIDLFDLFSNKDVSHDWENIELGRKVNLIVDKNKTVFEPIIVSIEHSPDNSSLNMTVSNKAYLNDDLNYITSLYAKFGTTSTIVDKDKDKWDDALDSEEFEEYKSSDINANERNIILTDEESLVQQAQITRRGIFMREGQNDVGQMRIFSDRIVFSRTNWNPVGDYPGYSVAITSLGIQTSEEFILRTKNEFGGQNLVRISGTGIDIHGSDTAGQGIRMFNKFGTQTFGLDSNGNINMTGNITITGGSGLGNLDGVGNLATKDNVDWSAEVVGSGKPQNNATVGATWGTNISNRPTTLLTPSGTGLFLSDSHMGYFESGVWKTYIQNNGNFIFSGDGNNYISWNGSVLTVRGQLDADNITSGTLSSIDINGSRFYGDTTSSGYMKIGTRGGNWGDMTIYRGGTTTPTINFYDDAGVMHLIPYGTDGSISGRILSMFNGTAEPRGNWNFLNCTVQNLQVRFS